MKFLAALALVSLAAAGNDIWDVPAITKFPFHFRGEISNKLVQVGDLDLFHAIWEQGFHLGSDSGISGEDDYAAFGNRLKCLYKDTKPDLHITVKIEGTFGSFENPPKSNQFIDGYSIRDMLIHALWAAAGILQVEGGAVWTDCRECGWAGCSDDPHATCGSTGVPNCACDEHFGGGNEADGLCFGRKSNMSIPAALRIQIFDQHSVAQVPYISLTIDSEPIPNPNGGCGRPGAVAEVLTSIIPVFGKSFSDLIKIACRGSW